jgi:hypothetical protein
VLSKNQDPPETTTPELEELVTGVVDDCSPDEVVLAVDEDAVVVLAVELLAVPGIVWALTAAKKPTATRALTAAPVVSLLSRRMAASRARTLSWVVSSIPMF